MSMTKHVRGYRDHTFRVVNLELNKKITCEGRKYSKEDYDDDARYHADDSQT